jgi:chromosome segregation ATPase
VAVATREYLELKATTNAHIAVLETRTGGDRATLDAYEKLERELDQVVMQAADAADPTETLLGYGQHIPGTAKRRLKQGVMLARKLLAAQRELKRSQEDAATLRQKVTELEDELNQSNGLLTNVRTQPHQVLVEDLRQRDRSAKELRTKLNDMTTKASRLEAENVELLQVQNAMSSDLERLLDSEGEMREMRVALADLQSASHHQQQQKPPEARRPGVAVSRSSGRRRGVGAT